MAKCILFHPTNAIEGRTCPQSFSIAMLLKLFRAAMFYVQIGEKSFAQSLNISFFHASHCEQNFNVYLSSQRYQFTSPEYERRPAGEEEM